MFFFQFLKEHYEYNLDNYIDFFEGRVDSTIFKKMYQNVDAIMDQPSCNVWNNVFQQFPEAKVILMVRDSEDVWLKSYKGTITVQICCNKCSVPLEPKHQA